MYRRNRPSANSLAFQCSAKNGNFQVTFHENLRRDDRPEGSSNRSFGVTLAAFCLLVGMIRTYLHDEVAYGWFATALVLGAPALVYPRVLAPFNRAWTLLGLLLFKVVSPVVLACLYYGCFVPMGFLLRAYGKDPLRRRREPDKKSYWIERSESDRAIRMKNQF